MKPGDQIWYQTEAFYQLGMFEPVTPAMWRPGRVHSLGDPYGVWVVTQSGPVEWFESCKLRTEEQHARALVMV